MADLSILARRCAKRSRRRQNTRRRKFGNAIGLRLELLESRQLLAVLGDPIVDSDPTSDDSITLLQSPIEADEGGTAAESDYEGADYSYSTDMATESGIVAETLSYQDDVPAGLEGSAAEDAAAYFDTLREYYDEATVTFGVDDDTDWSEVALALDEQATDIEMPDDDSFIVFNSLATIDDSSLGTDLNALGDSSWAFGDDPLSTIATTDAVDVGSIANWEIVDALPDSLDASSLPETPDDIYVSILDGPTESNAENEEQQNTSAGVSEPLGASLVSGVFASPQYGATGGTRVSVSDTTFGILAGIQDRWDAARNGDASQDNDESDSPLAADSENSVEPQTEPNGTLESSGESNLVSPVVPGEVAPSEVATGESAGDPAEGEGPPVVTNTTGEFAIDAQNLSLPKLPDFSATDPHLPGLAHSGDLTTFQPPSGNIPRTTNTSNNTTTTSFTDDLGGNCTATIDRTTTVTQEASELPAWYLEILRTEYLVVTDCAYPDGTARTTDQSGSSFYQLQISGEWPHIDSIYLEDNTRDAFVDTVTQRWSGTGASGTGASGTGASGAVNSGATVTRRDGWIEKTSQYDRDFTLAADGVTKLESFSKSKEIRLDEVSTVDSNANYDRSDPTPGVVNFDKGYAFVSTRDHVYFSTGEAEGRAFDGTMTYISQPMRMLADGTGHSGVFLNGAEYTGETIPNGTTWNEYNYSIVNSDDYGYDRGIEGKRANDGSGWKDVPSKSWSYQSNSTKTEFKVWIDAGSKEDIAGPPADIHHEDIVHYEVWSKDESSLDTNRDVLYDASGGETVRGSGGASGNSSGGSEVRYEGKFTYDAVEGSLATGGDGADDHQWADYKVHDINTYSSYYGVGTTTTTNGATGEVETAGGGSGGSSMNGDSGARFTGGATYDFVDTTGSSTEVANTFVSYATNSFDKYSRDDTYTITLQADGEVATTTHPPLAKTWGGSKSELDAWGKYAFDDVVGKLPLGDGETTHDHSGYFVNVDDEYNYEFRFDTPGTLASLGVISNTYSHIDGKGASNFKAWGTYDYDYRKDTKEVHDFIGIDVSDDASYEYDFTYGAQVKDDGALSVGGGGYDNSKEDGESKFYGYGSYDDSLETGSFASGGDGSRFAENHGYEFEFTDEYLYESKTSAQAKTTGVAIDERGGYLNSITEKSESSYKVWGSVEEETKQDKDNTYARIDYESWGKSEYKANDFEIGTPIAHDFLQIEGKGTVFSVSEGGTKIDGHGHADYYTDHGSYSAGDGWEATSKNTWLVDVDDKYYFTTSLNNDRNNFQFSGPYSRTTGNDFGNVQYDAKYVSLTDSTYDEKRDAAAYESHSTTTREVKANDEYRHFFDFNHSMYADTNNFTKGTSMPVGKAYERASSQGHDKSFTISDGKEYWTTNWSSGNSFDNYTHDSTWNSYNDTGSSYDSEFEVETTKAPLSGWRTSKSHDKGQSWAIGESKYETKDDHIYSYYDPYYSSGGEEKLHSTDESKYQYDSKYENKSETQADGTVTNSKDSSTSDSSEQTYSWNNTYTNWYTDPLMGVTTMSWVDADSNTYSYVFSDASSSSETIPGSGTSGDSKEADLKDPWLGLFQAGLGSPGSSSGRWWSPWRWMWTGDGHASDEMMNVSLVAAGNSVKDNQARSALKVMATVDPTPLSGCVEATLSGVENGDSVTRIAANCAIEAVPIPGFAEAKKAAKAGKNLVKEGAQKATKYSDEIVTKLRKGKSTAKINCFVAGTPTHVVQEGQSHAVGNVVMAISFGVFVTSEYVDRKRRKKHGPWSPQDLDDCGIGSAMDELERDDSFNGMSSDEHDLFRDTVDVLFGESYEQEALETSIATLVRPSRCRSTAPYDGSPNPSIQSRLAVSTVSEGYRTFASRPTTRSGSKPSDDITWTRTLGIMALCAGLLFGLFSIVPSGRGPAVTTKPIEQVRVGQRVLVDAPEEALAADFARLTSTALFWDQGDGSWKLEADADPLREIQQATSQQITKADYRLVKLKAHSVWEDGTVDTINVETLQPWQWIHHHEAHIGAFAPLPIDALEMGLPEDLTGKVLDILPCPPLRAGPGRVVLTTVDHLNKDVVELTLRNADGETETLRPTGTHKFYSVTHGEWLSASQLAKGEHLDGTNGKVTVVDIKHLPGTHRVYNMTVHGEHLYRVAQCGVLVHNEGCSDIVSEIGISGSGRKIDVGAPNAVVTRTNAQLVDEIGTRSRGWAQRKQLTGSARALGSRQHKHAKDVLDRYQRMFGDRGLATERSFIDGLEVPYGSKGSARLDVLDTITGDVWDYKFGVTPMSRSQINRIFQHGPGINLVTPLYK